METHLSGIEYYLLPRGYGPELVLPPQFVCVHKTANTASARREASYAHSRTDSNKTSAHFYVDGVEVLGSVPLNFRAWAARAHGNAHGWHVEICGPQGTFDETHLSADRRAAEIVRRLCELGNIPKQKITAGQARDGIRGVLGHADVTAAWPEDHGTHTDPGWSGSQWNLFMSWVGTVVPKPKPVVKGDPIMSKLPMLRRGMTGQKVRNMQHLILAHGVGVGVAGADGVFGAETEKGLRVFQTRKHIGVDGVCGDQSWTFLLDVQ